MVVECVTGVIEEIRFNSDPEAINSIKNIFSEWNVSKKGEAFVIKDYNERKKMILTPAKAQLVCLSEHAKNEKNLRDIDDAIKRAINYRSLPKETQEKIRKLKVKTRLNYDTLPLDLENKDIRFALEVFKGSDLESMALSEENIVYSFYPSINNKFIVAYEENFGDILKTYKKITKKFTFPKTKLDMPSYVI